MSIFTSLRTSTNAYNSSSLAVRTVGHNISDEGNEGYNRQSGKMATLPPSPDVSLFVGTDVEVARLERVVNDRVEYSVRNELSKFQSFGSQKTALDRLERVFEDLRGSGLEEAMNGFFIAAERLFNRPEDAAARMVFTRAAQALGETFRTRDAELRDLREDLNVRVDKAVQAANSLINDIVEMNRAVVASESGLEEVETADDLRDIRDAKVRDLAGLLDVYVVETSSGAVSVTTGSDTLVDGSRTDLFKTTLQTDVDVLLSNVELVDTGQALYPAAGAIGGLLTARDDIVVRYRQKLSALASAVISEVNRVHSCGVGCAGYSTVTAESAVSSVNGSLAEAGLPVTPVNGGFQIKVRNELTDQVKTFDVAVDFDGLGGGDMTLEGLRDSINTAVQETFPSITASIGPRARLRIDSSDNDTTFWFANDTSGVLATVGIGGLFTGKNATDIAVSEAIFDDPRLVATGVDGRRNDTKTIEALLDLRNAKVMQIGEATLAEYYRDLLGALRVETAWVRDMLEHQDAIRGHLQNQRSAISSVNIDEESIELIKYQRMYQGSASYPGVVDSILRGLLNIL